ncbi:MAG: ATP-binding cassette domain-containing protein, partial [Thermoflexales bacterium]|nr:ATP-binding cassette domain-containing protein [Thermoflexales bacterium]
PSELSGGQQQRVAIARAMANDPAILVGDEMTGDLDSVTGFEIMELVTKLNRERGTTVVYVTHDPRMAKYAHRCIQLRDGKIVAENGNGATPAVDPGGLLIDDDGKLIVDRK